MSNTIAELQAILGVDYSPLERGLDVSDRLLRDFGNKKYPAPKIEAPNFTALQDQIKSLSATLASTTGKSYVFKPTVDLTDFNRQMGQMKAQIDQVNGSANAPQRRGQSSSGAHSGFQLMGVGALATGAITLPFEAASAAILKAGGDFEAVTNKVVATTNIKISERASVMRRLLEMSNDPLIKATPSQLGETLLVTGSKGQSKDAALKAAQEASYGSSAGLGDAKTVGKLITDVQSAYGLGSDALRKITDQTTEAVKRGAGDTTAYAAAIAKVVPIAAQAGIKYSQLVANIAQATKIGLTPSEGATGLRQGLSNIIKPTEAATKALRDMGTTAAQVRASIDSKGMLATFEDLYKRSGGDIEPLSKIFGSIRALTEFLATTGKHTLADYKETLDGITNSDGATFEAARVNASGFNFQLEKLQSTLQKTGIELSSTVLPELTHFVEIIGKDIPAAVRAWETLPTAAKLVIGGFAGVGALIGPLTSLAGLLKVILDLKKTLGAGALFGAAAGGEALAGGEAAGGVAAAATLAIPGWIAIVGLLAAAATGAVLLKKHFDDAANTEEKLRQNTEHIGAAWDMAFKVVNNGALKKHLEDLQGTIADAGEDTGKLSDALRKMQAMKLEVKTLGLAPGAEDVLMSRIDKIIAGIQQKFSHLGVTPTDGAADIFTAADKRYDALAARAKTLGIAMPAKPERKMSQGVGYDGMPYELADESLPAAKKYAADMANALQAVQVKIADATKVSEAQWKKTIGGRLETVLSTDPNNLRRILALIKEFDDKKAGGFAPNEKSRGVYAEASDHVKELRQKVAADAQDQKNARDILDKEAKKRAAAARELDAQRAVKAEEGRLTTSSQSWEKTAALTESTVSKNQQIAESLSGIDKETNRAKTTTELLKRAYSDLPRPVKEWEINLAGVGDQMNRIGGFVETFRKTFNSAFRDMSATDQRTFDALISQYQKRLNLPGQMSKLQGQSDNYARALISASERNLSANATRKEQLSTAAGGIGASTFAADKYIDAGGAGKMLVDSARSYLGQNGSNARATGAAYGKEWCAGFVQARLADAGMKELAGGSLSVRGIRAWGKANGHTTNDPQPGDVFTVDRPGLRHTAIVSARNGDMVTTIGGNEGARNNYASKVKEGATYNIHSGGVLFIRPDSGTALPSLPPGVTDTSVAARIAATPARDVRAERQIALPPQAIADMRLRTAQPLPGAWGTPMSQYQARPGESTAYRSQLEGDIAKERETVDSLEHSVLLQQLAIYKKRHDGVKVTQAELNKLAAAQAAARQSRNQLAGVLDPENLKQLRGIGDFVDVSLSAKAATSKARDAIKQMGTEIRSLGKENNPYLILFDEFNKGAYQFLDAHGRMALLKTTLQKMTAETANALKQTKEQVDAQMAPFRETAPLLNSGSYNSADFERAQFAAKVRQDAEADEKVKVLRRLGQNAQADKYVNGQVEQQGRPFLAAQWQNAQREYDDQLKAQRDSNSLATFQLNLLNKTRMTQQEIADAVEVEAVRRQTLAKLTDSAPYFSPEQAADNERKAQDAADAKATELKGKRANDDRQKRLSDERDYQSQLKGIRQNRSITAEFGYGDPEEDIRRQRAAKQLELEAYNADPKRGGPVVDVQKELQKFVNIARGNQADQRERDSKAHVYQLENDALSVQQNKLMSLAKTESDRFAIQLSFDAKRRALTKDTETEDEKAARLRLEAIESEDAAATDAANRRKAEATEVRSALRSAMDGDWKSPLQALNSKIKDSAADSLTAALFGKNSVDSQGDLLDLLRGPKKAKVPGIFESSDGPVNLATGVVGYGPAALNAPGVSDHLTNNLRNPIAKLQQFFGGTHSASAKPAGAVTLHASSIQSHTTSSTVTAHGSVTVRGSTVNVNGGASSPFDVGSVAGFSTNGRAGSSASADQIVGNLARQGPGY